MALEGLEWNCRHYRLCLCVWNDLEPTQGAFQSLCVISQPCFEPKIREKQIKHIQHSIWTTREYTLAVLQQHRQLYCKACCSRIDVNNSERLRWRWGEATRVQAEQCGHRSANIALERGGKRDPKHTQKAWMHLIQASIHIYSHPEWSLLNRCRPKHTCTLFAEEADVSGAGKARSKLKPR